MICIHQSYCWYMTCCDWSSQAVESFSLCFTEPWRSSVPGSHDAEAAVFFNIRGSVLSLQHGAIHHRFHDKNVKVCPYDQLRYEYVIIYHIYYLDTNEIFYSYDMILYTYECSMTGLRCNYSPLSPLHWRTRWWLRRCVGHFRPRQHVGCASSALLQMYFASHQCSQGSLQLFSGWHWSRPGVLQRLWGSSPPYLWDHGEKRN